MSVIIISIQASRCLAAHSQTILFALDKSDTIQRQHMWKMKWLCHLKHSLGLQIYRKFIWKSFECQQQFLLLHENYSFFSTLNFYCLTWLHRPQLTLTRQCPNNQKFLNAIEADQYTTTQELEKLVTKNSQIIVRFLLKVSEEPIISWKP